MIFVVWRFFEILRQTRGRLAEGAGNRPISNILKPGIFRMEGRGFARILIHGTINKAPSPCSLNQTRPPTDFSEAFVNALGACQVQGAGHRVLEHGAPAAKGKILLGNGKAKAFADERLDAGAFPPQPG
jgi:hypothetical protein